MDSNEDKASDKPTTTGKRAKKKTILSDERTPDKTKGGGGTSTSPSTINKRTRAQNKRQGKTPSPKKLIFIPTPPMPVATTSTDKIKGRRPKLKPEACSSGIVTKAKNRKGKGPSPKKSANKSAKLSLEDLMASTSTLPKLREYKIPKRKIHSNANNEFGNNSFGVGGSTSTSQFKNPASVVPEFKRTKKAVDTKSEENGTTSECLAGMGKLGDVASTGGCGRSDLNGIGKGARTYSLNTEPYPNVTKTHRPSNSVHEKQVSEVLRFSRAGESSKKKNYDGASSTSPAPLRNCGYASSSAPIPANGHLHGDVAALSKAEEMDFDNPVPEILQMVTEASASNSIYGNDTFDAMEVDSVPSTSSKKHLVLIPDTNVWIESIQVLQDILNTKKFQPSPPSTSTSPDVSLNIVIPWMVLQEIDYSIHRNKAYNKKREFQNAAKFIHALLSKKDDRVRGQKAAEAAIGIEFNELMADDSILNCAIQHNKHPQFITVFITNDINLLNKALVHNLTAFKAEAGLIDTLLQLSKNGTETDISSFSSFAAPSSNFMTTGQAEPALQIQCQPTFDASVEIGMDIDDPMGEEAPFENNSVVPSQPVLAPTFDIVINELRKSLTHIIVPKMVDEYGEDGWKYAIKVKPPFSVESGLKCIQLHWIAVFSFLFPTRGREVLEELIGAFRNKPGPHNGDEIRSWRQNLCRIALVFLSMNNALVKKPRISDTVKLLKDYVESS